MTNCDIVCNNVCNEKRVVPGTKATTQREGPVGDTRQGYSTTPQQVICNKAGECGINECMHSVPHAHTLPCDRKCERYPGGVCVPYVSENIPTADAVAFTATPESEDVFYKMMWNRLRGELQEFQDTDCHTIDPIVVLRFMDYIEEATPCHQS